MARRFLIRRDVTGSLDENDSYVSELGSKIEIKDVMDINERYISFADKEQKAKKLKNYNFQKTKEGLRWALDAAGNAGQYIKFVNMTIDKRQAEIEKIKSLQDKFDNEIQMLSSHKIEKLHLDPEDFEGSGIDKITDYLNQLLLEKRISKSKFQSLKSDLDGMEQDLQNQEKEIEHVRNHIKTKTEEKSKIPEPDVETAIETIRKELSEISEKYDVSKISEAMNLVLSSQESKK